MALIHSANPDEYPFDYENMWTLEWGEASLPWKGFSWRPPVQRNITNKTNETCSPPDPSSHPSATGYKTARWKARETLKCVWQHLVA